MLLGHAPHGDLTVEPYLITLQDSSDVFPVFQHDGLEFIYMLEGEVVYRHGDKSYILEPGDSLFFDANAPHGPGRHAEAANTLFVNHQLPARHIEKLIIDVSLQ